MINEQWKQDVQNDGAILEWVNYNRAQCIWRNPDDNKSPMVLYIRLNYDFPHNCQRLTFDKSWNDICRDPRTPDYIAQRFRDGCSDDVSFVYEWAEKGQDPESAPFDIGDLYFSEYPRDEYVY